ncbi:hypothetical protein DICPUDRAFT_57918 [Dictyostelium purpureum]|uniref:Uncharacterized protein n=1 Tax=Dictyostelium purpureum TaxID=5786 RepID=F0ZY91_DICPU|nr:uncharacterized protein DICPUDRAFT_57918 [Dictyostelium purpureum]EGC31084.1 hypothetical protein DICPUDRAFT_57918 [Dictyostelium purpureum]|eukprot:XP_003292385.1 hypothetical protein DICPUDRAFT_57918 [Dictyostelium purpureum]
MVYNYNSLYPIITRCLKQKNKQLKLKRNYSTIIKTLDINNNEFKELLEEQQKQQQNLQKENNILNKFYKNSIINNINQLNFNNNSKRYYSSTKNNLKEISDYESVGFSLLPIINKLQENAALIGSEITLPQIIVVGSQSSGKSSVLESLVGRDFLPRGSGLVTRRPLVLQLYQNEDSNEEWGEFGHTGDRKFSYFEIKEEIEKETERIAGAKKDISPEPIILKIHSPNVIPLTLVDLPGLTRVAVDDQPIDIEEKVRSMILSYINNPNSIILAITPANQDIVTSDALKLAQQVDPLGKRTVGVLTKLDLMDKGTDALDILLGNEIPLSMGFVGVVNRSQQDINYGKPISDSLKDEVKWFQNHPVYSRVFNQSGSKYLAQKCNKILTKHIRDTFPTVKNQIKILIKKYEEELEKYGDPVPNRSGEKARLLIDILTKYSNQYRSDLEGTNEDLVLTNFNGGARIRYIFSKAFENQKEKPFDWLSDQQLKVALRNASGLKSTMFIPQKIFDSLIKKQIEKVKEPMLQCSELVLEELLRILGQVDSTLLSRFPVLRERIVEVSNNSLRKLLKPCNQMISDLVDAEASFINTTHPNYISQLNDPYIIDRSYPIDSQIKQQQQQQQYQQQKYQQQQQVQQESSGFLSRIFGSQSSQPQPQPQPQQTHSYQQQPQTNYNNKPKSINIISEKPSNLEQYGLNDITEEERRQINLLRRLLTVYFKDVAQFNIQQNTMKAISLLLIDKSKDTIHKELINSLYDTSLVEQLLRENELVIAKRAECIYKLELLKKAKKSLNVDDLPLQFY